MTFFPDRYGRELVELMLRMHRGEAMEPAYYVRHEFLDWDAARKMCDAAGQAWRVAEVS